MRVPDEMAKAAERGTLRRIGEAVAEAAPTIAGALGGPLAGAAVEALRRAVLGDAADTGDRSLPDLLLAADPETLLAVRRAELDFKRALSDAQVEAQRIAAGDRASARARQVSLRDATPAVLGGAVIAGFFGVLCVMLWRELPAHAAPTFSIMLGALSTMTGAVVNYYFGSSASSREKTRMMGVRL